MVPSVTLGLASRSLDIRVGDYMDAVGEGPNGNGGMVNRILCLW